MGKECILVWKQLYITVRVTLVEFVQTAALYILWLFNTSILMERRWM